MWVPSQQFLGRFTTRSTLLYYSFVSYQHITEVNYFASMAYGEKKIFLPYSRGIDPTTLRIGHLTINTYNPTNDLDTGRLEFREKYV
jgi:hypothetical protein